MSADEFRLDGAEVLHNLLKTFPVKIERRLLKRALRTGGTVLSKEAKRLAAKRSGTLRKAIAVRSVKHQPAVQVYVRRGKGEKNDGWYAHIVERGSRPHEIKTWKGRKKVLSGGGKTYGKRVMHPGAKARPFMKPALESAGPQAVRTVGNRLAQLIEREVKR